MRDTPMCRKCGTPHWNMKPCPTVGPVDRPDPVFRAVRPRDGFREYGDLLDTETVRMGETTFARRRTPGERHGGLRAVEGEAA